MLGSAWLAFAILSDFIFLLTRHQVDRTLGLPALHVAFLRLGAKLIVVWQQQQQEDEEGADGGESGPPGREL